MRNKSRSAWLVLVSLLTLSEIGQAQGEQQNRRLIVNGQTGEALVIQINGRSYIDFETLARIGNGSVGFQDNQIVLTLPAPGNAPAIAPASNQPADPGFSRDFMTAGIEEMAVIREWRSALAYAIQNGYPVAKNWVAGYRDRAAESLRLASVAASTDSDRNALPLLNNEFANVRTWSSKIIEARQSMDAAKYMSPDALDNDPLFQKILSCAHFLGPMLTSGKFQDDPSCH